MSTPSMVAMARMVYLWECEELADTEVTMFERWRTLMQQRACLTV